VDKIRVLYINETARIAGAETWFLNFIAGLRDTSVEPIVLCPDGAFAGAVQKRGVRVIRYTFRFFDLSAHRFWRYPLFGIFRLYDCIRIALIMKRHNIDIVQSLNVSGHVITGFMRILFRKTTVWHIHQDINPLPYRLFNPARIVFVARQRQKILESLSLENRRRHVVLYNGVDTALFGVNRSGGRRTTAGYAGRLMPAKGLDALVAAAADVLKAFPDMTEKKYTITA